MAWSLKKRRVNRLLAVHRYNYSRPEEELLSPKALETSRHLFGPRILRERLAHRWPGTISLYHRALIQVVAFDQDLADSMVNEAPLLFDWLGTNEPSLPEDICLFRQGDDLPVLVSVTHEKDAWIIAEEQPSIAGLTKEDFDADEFYIPSQDPDFLGDDPE